MNATPIEAVIASSWIIPIGSKISVRTLILLPIGMIQELAITASIGVAFKIITNLVMLPLAASYARYNESFATRAQSAITYRQNLMGFFGKLAKPRPVEV